MTQLPRGRGLCIGEKSSIKEKLEKAYRDICTELPFTLDFECFAGHVVEMEMPGEINPAWSEWKMENLPMVPSQWRYRKSEIDNKARRYDQVMNKLKSGGYDFIINAGDPEREGQLIQDAFFSTMDSNLKATPIYRMWFRDEKPETLKASMKNLLSMEDNIPNAGKVRHLSEASFLRARMDWLIGLNSTQALTLLAGGKVRVGRVQTPILKILVDRELAIRNFKIEPFWTVKVAFQHPNGVYVGTLLDEDGKPAQFFDKSKAEAALAGLDTAEKPKIVSKTVATTKENPPKFFSTGSLQGAAAKVYGISMTESLGALQYLYEKEITSYPRTDSEYITVAMAQDIVDTFETARQLPELKHLSVPSPEQVAQFAKNKSYANDANVRAHTALQPLANIQIAFNTLTQIQKEILYLIARSVVLPFLGPVVKEKTELITQIGDLKFKTNGSVVLDEGWSKEVPEYSSKDQTLPSVNEGDGVEIAKAELNEGKTTPPKRYNPDSLVKVLENVHRLLENDEAKLAMQRAEGLGRPSTRTSIIEGLIESGYITLSKKQEFEATDFGIGLVQALGNTPLVSPQLTASWEAKLQDLEDGKLSSQDLYLQMVEFTKKSTESLKKLNLDLQHAKSGKEPIGTLDNGNDVFESKTGYYDTEFMAYMKESDQAKAEGLPVPQFRGFYLSKTIDNDSMKMTGSITRKDMIHLLSGKSIHKDFTWKKRDNSKSTVEMVLDENHRLAFVKKAGPQVEEREIGGYKIKRMTGTNKKNQPYDIYVFEDPEFIVNVKNFGYEVTWENLAQLINGEMLERQLVGKSGKPFPGNLKLVMGEGIKMEFIQSDEEQVSANVKRITRDGRVFYRLSNGVYVQSTVSGHTWTIDELETIATKGEIYITDFVSKSGKNFEALMVVDGNSLNFKFK